jgi:signal transduction histidine kinase
MSKLQLLHLEDSPSDAFFVRTALAEAGISADIIHTSSREEFISNAGNRGLDAILVDNGVPDVTCQGAIEIARSRSPGTPVIVVSSSANPQQVSATLHAGAQDYVLKGQWWQLVSALERAKEMRKKALAQNNAEHRQQGLAQLLTAVQKLSLTRDLNGIMAIIRHVARELVGADGATFVLRDGDQCFYADEEAIEPLWKGQRFPLSRCISGWVMLNRQVVVIPDIYADSRIPVEAYRPTFVKSLVMVPIRAEEPIGAIGTYWATKHVPPEADIELLQTLANTAAVSMENVNLYGELEGRVRSRTVQLEAANQELEAFSYSVAHDLRGPLHAIGGYADLLAMKLERQMDAEARDYLGEIHAGVERMTGLIDDLLRLAKFGRVELKPEQVDLGAVARELFSRISCMSPGRTVDFQVQPNLEAWGDRGLLRIVIDNLLSNAWKYSARRAVAVIEFGKMPTRDGQRIFFVRDNGAGFDPQFSEKLFAPFKRLHRDHEFEGTGVGLATVQRILHRHGGLIWAEAEVDKGATFYFSLPEGPAAADRPAVFLSGETPAAEA